MEQRFYPMGADPGAEALGGRVREDLEAAEALLTGWQEAVVQRYPEYLRHLVWDVAGLKRLEAAVRLVVEEGLASESGTGYRRGLLSLYVRSLMNRLTGLGPLDPLLVDDSIGEIMINGTQSMFVERRGRLQPVTSPFVDAEEVAVLAQRLASRAGRNLNSEQPLCDAPLADGSRIHCVLPPVAREAVVTIRRMPGRRLRLEELLADGSLDAQGWEWLREAVRTRANVVVAGGASSGKTSLLRLLAAELPTDERVVTIEDVRELNLESIHPHIVSLEASPSHPLRTLVAHALRMRPDRLVVGEVRGEESFDLLEAMASGHAGLSSVHSPDDPWETVHRLARLALRAVPTVGFRAMVAQILQALDVVVLMRRTGDGRRLMTRVAEVSSKGIQTVWQHTTH